MSPMSWPTTLAFSTPSERASAWMRMAARFMSRRVRITDPGQVGCDHREGPGEARKDRLPHARRLRVAMDQDHRRTVTGREVVQPDAVDVGGARDDGGVSCRGARGPRYGRKENARYGQRSQATDTPMARHGSPLLWRLCRLPSGVAACHDPENAARKLAVPVTMLTPTRQVHTGAGHATSDGSSRNREVARRWPAVCRHLGSRRPLGTADSTPSRNVPLGPQPDGERGGPVRNGPGTAIAPPRPMASRPMVDGRRPGPHRA